MDRSIQESASQSSDPPTVIVVHPKEKRRKCSVEPLRGRAGFAFWNWPKRGVESLEGYVRLGLGGPLLSADDAKCGLLLLDGTWRLASRMEADFQALPVRTLPSEWKSAYPRISKLADDPLSGLATIEALYAAYVALGRDADRLLDDYHWKNDFLRLNHRLD